MSSVGIQTSSKVIAQGNEQVNARYCLPVRCHRLLALAMSKLSWRKGSAPTLGVVVSAEDYRQAFGNKAQSSTAYTELKRAANDLQTTTHAVVSVPTAHGYRQVAWFSSVHYATGEGIVELVFSDAIRPLLVNLWSDFTTSELALVARLQSKHSIRLYWLLRQYRDSGCRIERLDNLSDMLMLGKGYSKPSAMIAKVIEPALVELRSVGPVKQSFAATESTTAGRHFQKHGPL